MNKKIISCVSILVLLLGLAWSCAIRKTSTTKNGSYYENNQTLQVKNEVYTLERERNEANIYNVTINYPQLEEEVQDAHAYAGDVINYDILQLDNDYISLVFSIDSCVGGPSYTHQYPVTIDIEKGEYIYFSDFADIDVVQQMLQSGNFEVYAGTYSEFSDEDAHDSDVINLFAKTFRKQVSAGTTGEGFDRFSSQNIGLDQQYLYIYFPFENGISFHGYYILGIPRNQLD